MKSELSGREQAIAEKNQELARLLEKKYAAWLGERFFEVSSVEQAAAVTVIVTLRNSDKSFFYPIEGRMQVEDQDLKLERARELLLDYVDAYIEEFLTGGEETYLPIDWANYECEGLELQLRGQILNLKLEALADEILGETNLVH